MAVQNAFVTVDGLEAAAATETTVSYGPAVQDVAELRAVPLSARADKQQRLVEDAGANYTFDTQGAGADNGDTILLPDDGGPGRWFKVAPATVPLPHAASHQDGGSDEISVNGLLGTLSDIQKVEVQDEGAVVASRSKLNFTGSGVVVTDDAGNGRVHIDVPGAGAATGFETQEDGASVESLTLFLNARKGILASAGAANQAHLDLDYGGTAELADADAGAEAAGISDRVPRADHKHSIPTGVPGSILPDAVADAGTATTLSRSDHTHAIAADVPGSILPDDTAAEGVAASFARSDHRHAIAADVPVNVTKAANAEGVSTSFARADHKHDVSTAAPGTILPDDAAAEGVATSLSRSDHKHAIATDSAGTILVGDAAAEGVASSFARSDHKHALPAPAAPADVTKAAASAGAATTVARADHKHALPAPAAPADVTKAAASAGAATTVARADHKHDVSTAAAGTILPDDAAAEGAATSLSRSDHKHAIAADVAVDVGTANSEGASTAFSRADHVHNLPLSTLASLLNASITEATGDITTTSATDVVATGLSVTPAAGTYLVWLGGSLESSNASAVLFTSIYKDGVQVAASERETDAPGSNESTGFACMALVTVNGSQAIDGRWRTTAGTGTMHERQLLLVRVA